VANREESSGGAFPPVVELLPHRPPAVYLDAVESFDPDAGSLTVRAVAAAGRTAGVCAIEYMAQAAAALAGMFDRLAGHDPLPGFLLGTRKLDLRVAAFAEGTVYRIQAERAFSDGEAASFACEMTDTEGRVVASATLNAYRPENTASFLAEQGGAT